MDNNQYLELMKHLKYIENMLENVSNELLIWKQEKEGGCECPICGEKFYKFLSFGNHGKIRQNSQCPKCKSLERHRALWLVMQQLKWYRPNMRVLHFAPERIFHSIFSLVENIEYWPVDLDPKKFGVKKIVDITDITFEDNYFDLIMCNHVLEHIPDDKKAMQELYRVLKPQTGIAFLNVPIFNISETLENPEYNIPELHLKYYGQEDHVRAYGSDYPERLEAIGFKVEIHSINFDDESNFKKYGINPYEKIYVCRKF